MARRVSLPAADDLFRPTVEAVSEPVVRAVPDAVEAPARRTRATPATRPDAAPDAAPDSGTEVTKPARKAAKPASKPASKSASTAASRKSSGRVKHDEKMTVYVTSDELLDLEHARLTLRRTHGLAVDRGRIVREAIALVLADFDEHGEDSALVKRLGES